MNYIKSELTLEQIENEREKALLDREINNQVFLALAHEKARQTQENASKRAHLAVEVEKQINKQINKLGEN